jgi:NTE family protein
MNAADSVSAHAAEKYLAPLPGPAAGRIAVCLAGAGFRSLPFALGALRRLNEFGLLSRTATIAASGGPAIVAAALAVHWRGLRPDARGAFANFESLIARPLDRFAVRSPVLRLPLHERLRPAVWAKLWRREHTTADLMADYLDRTLLRRSTLAEIPGEPAFAFSGLNLKTGEMWEMRRTGVGDPLLGYAPAGGIRLAEAAAIGLLDPVDSPALTLRRDPVGFTGGVLGSAADPWRNAAPLVSGETADPLATEAAWRNHGILLVVDAGRRALSWSAAPGTGVGRLRRLAEIQAARCRDEKKRWLIHAFAHRARAGAYIGLSAYHGHYGLVGSVGFPEAVVESLLRLPSDAHPVRQHDLPLLSNHGYSLADAAVRRYLSNLDRSGEIIAVPYPDALAPGSVRRVPPATAA